MSVEQVVLIAAFGLILMFEFINGFHDTANAVATVIYTNSLRPTVAVIWSGIWNFIGVVLSGGAVAASMLKLIPPDLLNLSDPNSSLAAVIAIPLAAIVWNFGTWYVGLPASSSHTLIGSILGVGLMHSAMQGEIGAGINWHKAGEVGLSLLISPAAGFVAAALLLKTAHVFLKRSALFREADPTRTPPLWIRCLLIFTCTSVSFAHGANDGQKGIGLLMFVLIVLLPQEYSFGPDTALVIPTWVKLLVAITLGCGTMIGWKRIVVTIGEKIGKAHMNYAQGAAAELVAMTAIQTASTFGLPVSTTHVLSSGVAGAMYAQGSGVQMGTVTKILAAWVLTLPVTIFLASAAFGAGAFILFRGLGIQ